MEPQGLLLSDDLIFTSRVSATARSQGLRLESARTLEGFWKKLSADVPACVLFDLQFPGLSLASFLENLPRPRPVLVAYGSHVQTDLLKQARDLGCDMVLPRSKFAEDLETDLAKWMGIS